MSKLKQVISERVMNLSDFVEYKLALFLYDTKAPASAIIIIMISICNCKIHVLPSDLVLSLVQLFLSDFN